MTRTNGLVLIAIVIAVFAVATAFKYGVQASNQFHCNMVLYGIAVKEDGSGNVVCIRRDSVLKIYK